MKIHFAFEELSDYHQQKFQAGIPLRNPENSYPAQNGYRRHLKNFLLFNIPLALFVLSVFGGFVYGMRSMFGATEGKDATQFLWGQVGFLLLCFGIVVYKAMGNIRLLLLRRKVHQIIQQKQVIHYGLLLDEYLVYRPVKLENQVSAIPRDAIIEAKQALFKRIPYTRVNYYHPQTGLKYYLSIYDYDMDKDFLNQEPLSNIINTWRGEAEDF